jgi:hypothetical protein
MQAHRPPTFNEFVAPAPWINAVFALLALSVAIVVADFAQSVL